MILEDTEIDESSKVLWESLACVKRKKLRLCWRRMASLFVWVDHVRTYLYIWEKGVLNSVYTLSYTNRRLLRWDDFGYYFRTPYVCLFKSTIIVLQNSGRTSGSTGVEPPLFTLMNTSSLLMVRELSLDLYISRYVWFLRWFLCYRWSAYEMLGVPHCMVFIFYW